MTPEDPDIDIPVIIRRHCGALTEAQRINLVHELKEYVTRWGDDRYTDGLDEGKTQFILYA